MNNANSLFLTYSSHSCLETEMIGQRFAESLKPGDFIALCGDLGAGKTAFTRGLAKVLSPEDRIASPTYTIVNEYRGRVSVFHFDTYRIEDDDDLFSTGYEDYIARDGYVICEWSERIEDFIPEDAVTVTVSRTDGADGRKIEIENGPEVI